MGCKVDARLTLLFIDRDPSIAGAVVDALAATMGLRVISAASFDLAENLLDKGQLDILVADIRVPGTGTGKEFIARFAERHPLAGIVLVSANPVLYTLFYPAQSVCLEKPYDADQLAQAIMESRHRVPTTKPPRAH